MHAEGTVYPEILAGIKFGGWALNRHCKNIGGFKFGSSVRDRHTYYMQARLPNCQIFNSPPNLPAIRYMLLRALAIKAIAIGAILVESCATELCLLD